MAGWDTPPYPSNRHNDKTLPFLNPPARIILRYENEPDENPEPHHPNRRPRGRVWEKGKRGGGNARRGNPTQRCDTQASPNPAEDGGENQAHAIREKAPTPAASTGDRVGEVGIYCRVDGAT